MACTANHETLLGARRTAMFAGRYKTVVDAKGRAVVPKPFRQVTPDTVWVRAMLVNGLEDCLFLYTVDDWNRLMAAVAQRSAGLPDVDTMTFQRLFAGSCHTVEADGFGRIVIPLEFREEFGLQGDCVWVGAVDRAELWALDRWNSYRQQSRNALKNIWDKMSRRGHQAEAGTHAPPTQSNSEARE